MNSQLQLRVPIQLIEELISFCRIKEQFAFRATCKRFKALVDSKFIPVTMRTICGSMQMGHKNGSPKKAQFQYPFFIAFHPSLQHLYVSDEHNGRIKRVLLLKSGTVETLCKQSISQPAGIAIDFKEQVLYICDDGTERAIKKISLKTSKITTLCGSKIIRHMDGKNASFEHPRGIAFDSKANCLYVADKQYIRRVDVTDGSVTTLCGGNARGYKDGTFSEALFTYLEGLVFNSSTQELFVADDGNHVVRRVSLLDQTVTTLVGKEGLTFSRPWGLGLDERSKYLYMSDWTNAIYKIFLESQKVIVFKGYDSDEVHGTKSTRYAPFSFAIDPYSPAVYVADRNNQRIRKIMDHTRTYIH